MRALLVAALVGGVLLAGGLSSGCKKKAEPVKPADSKTTPVTPTTPSTPTTPTTPATPTTPVAPSPAEIAAKEAQTALDKIAGLIKDGKLDEAETELKALEAKTDLPADLQAKVKAARASLDTAKAAAKAGAADKEAQAALDKIAGLIKDGKLAEAEAELKALEAKSGELSPDMQAKVKAAQASLDTAKAAASVKDNETLLEKILAMIKEGKLDDAGKMLTDLEGKSGSLPAPMQEKIKAARAALDVKKATGGLELPKIGQ